MNTASNIRCFLLEKLNNKRGEFMIHYMKLKAIPFKKIKNGAKTTELRLYDEKRQKIKIGDMIEFVNTEDKSQKLIVSVTALHIFDSFDELYKCLPMTACGYKKGEKANPSDMNIYYSPKEQEKYKAVGIDFVLMEHKDDKLTKISRYISMILRHKPYAANVVLDEHGWASVSQLLEGVSKKYILTMEILEKIVETDKKQRYSFNDDKTLIRANQGHSVNVDVEPEKKMPPLNLWHGTAEKYTESIEEKGIMSKGRLYVHLSDNYDTAVLVGSRHGNPVVYEIDAKRMYDDGYIFYVSVNKVWLTKYVPVPYIHRKNDQKDC